MDYLSDRAKNLKQGAIREMFDRAAAMENVISMGIGEPDMATPEVICQAAAEALRRGETHYTPNAGDMRLRRAIVQRSGIAGLGYDPAREVIVTNGGMGALSLLFLAILNSGDEVLIQDPQWLNYAVQVSYCGGRPVRVPTKAENGFQMEPAVIEGLVTPRTKALMINSPNNPTGEVMSRRRMEEIADLAQRHDLLIISDEVYSTLVYEDEPCRTIAALPGMKERTVVINSFSKAYAMCGWRIGYAAAPGDIVDRMTKCQENFNACPNAPGQCAAIAALEHPELCTQLRDEFAQRRDHLLARFRQIEGLRCNSAAGAFYLFPDISAFGLTSRDFCERLLEEERVVCIPGSAFGACGEGHIRVAYTCGMDALDTAASRIARFCKGVSAGK
jgi:aminotransferase